MKLCSLVVCNILRYVSCVVVCSVCLFKDCRAETESAAINVIAMPIINIVITIVVDISIIINTIIPNPSNILARGGARLGGGA